MLGPDRQGHPPGLHRAVGCGQGTFHRVHPTWGALYLAITRLCENAWSEFVPFLDYDDVEIRRIISSTKRCRILECLDRRAIRARGHLPTQHVAMNVSTS